MVSVSFLAVAIDEITASDERLASDIVGSVFWWLFFIGAVVMIVRAARRVGASNATLSSRYRALASAASWTAIAAFVSVVPAGLLATQLTRRLPDWYIVGITALSAAAISAAATISNLARYWRAREERAGQRGMLAGAVLAVQERFSAGVHRLRGSAVSWWHSLFDEVASERLRSATDEITAWRTGRKAIGVCAGLIVLALAMTSALRANVLTAEFLVQFASIYGLTLLLASTPAFIASWLVLALLSGDRRIGPSLRNAGDMAGRGLVVGIIIGIIDFTMRGAVERLGIVSVSAGSRSLTDWVALVLGLSVAGSVIGFAVAQLDLLDTICRSQRYPRMAWACTPFLVAVVLLAFSVLVISPATIYESLIHDLTADLTPIAPQSLTEADVARDWRYALTVDQSTTLTMLPSPIVLAMGWLLIVAVSLWGRWWRSTPRIASADRRTHGAETTRDSRPLRT